MNARFVRAIGDWIYAAGGDPTFLVQVEHSGRQLVTGWAFRSCVGLEAHRQPRDGPLLRPRYSPFVEGAMGCPPTVSGRT